MKRNLFSLLLLAGSVVVAHGGLRWEGLEQRMTLDPDDRSVTAHFEFVNTGNVPVEITRVKTNCGCTAAKPAVNPVPAGAKSEITVSFKFGDRKGAWSVPVTVKTDDPSEPETKLVLVVNILSPVEVAPQLVFWKKDEALTAKTVAIRKKGPDRIADVQAGPVAGLNVRAEQVKDGEEFRLSITPTGGEQSFRSEIPVSVRLASGKVKEFKVHVKVR